MAQDSETRNVSDLEAEEIEAAAAHAQVPVDPNSPGSPAAPPGFAVDHTQLLIELAKMLEKIDIMQVELSKVKTETANSILFTQAIRRKAMQRGSRRNIS